jgi:hypothetical protein
VLKSNAEIERSESYSLGLTYLAIGLREEAFHWIEVALRNREEPAVLFAFDPDFDEVRIDPRYEEIVRRQRDETLNSKKQVEPEFRTLRLQRARRSVLVKSEKKSAVHRHVTRPS